MVNISKVDFQQKSKKLGSGTQGSVYLYPLSTKTGQIKEVAIKIYRNKTLAGNDLQIETHLQRLLGTFRRMPANELKILRTATTMILDTVKIDDRFKGYVMRKIPEMYLPQKKNLYSDEVKIVERTLAYALNDDETKLKLQEPIISVTGRKIILLKLLYVMSIFHRNDIIVGDISPNNILIYVDSVDQKKNSILFLDTDSFRTKNAMFPLHQPHTPDWIPPECRNSDSDINKFFQSKQTDVWKIAILVLRLYYFGPQRTAIESSDEALNRISTEISKEFSELIRRGLDKNPDNRPSIVELLDTLRKG
ncbi:protein kinase [Streptococcus suis]|nr:protein kinase [Streptococcus suis]